MRGLYESQIYKCYFVVWIIAFKVRSCPHRCFSVQKLSLGTEWYWMRIKPVIFYANLIFKAAKNTNKFVKVTLIFLRTSFIFLSSSIFRVKMSYLFVDINMNLLKSYLDGVWMFGCDRWRDISLNEIFCMQIFVSIKEQCF